MSKKKKSLQHKSEKLYRQYLANPDIIGTEKTKTDHFEPHRFS